MGSAVVLAVQDVRRQLLALAAGMLEAAADDLVTADGRVAVRGAPERSLAYGEIVRRAQRGNLLGHGSFVTRGGLDPETVNALAVTVIGSGGLAGLVSSVRAWIGRAPKEARTVRLEISGDVIELSGATSLEQEHLLQVFLSRHEAATP